MSTNTSPNFRTNSTPKECFNRSLYACISSCWLQLFKNTVMFDWLREGSSSYSFKHQYCRSRFLACRQEKTNREKKLFCKQNKSAGVVIGSSYLVNNETIFKPKLLNCTYFQSCSWLNDHILSTVQSRGAFPKSIVNIGR